MVETVEQRTLSWYRMRLGYITGSQVGLLMKSGKSCIFSETAKSYIYQVAAERSMNPDIINDDELFGMYLAQTEVTSKAMRFGTEQEANARRLFSKIHDVNVREVSSCRHSSIPYFASSPDGIYTDETGKVCLEIKCPVQSTFMRYKDEIHDNESLLKVKPEYFYQCMANAFWSGADIGFMACARLRPTEQRRKATLSITDIIRKNNSSWHDGCFKQDRHIKCRSCSP